MYYMNIETNELNWTTEHLNIIKKADTIEDSIILTDEQTDYIFICADCGELINTNETDDYYKLSNGNVICQSCYDNSYFTCEECGEVITFDDAVKLQHHRYGEMYICEECADRNYYRCENCGDYFTLEQGSTDADGTFYCFDCQEYNGYYICDDCGYWTGDVHYCEETGENYCEDCYFQNHNEDDATIHNYNYMPDLNFHTHTIDSEKPIYYGFELEIHAQNPEDDAYTFLQCFNDEEIYLTSDSSIIDGGFEITSHPMTYNYLFKSDFKQRLINGLDYLKRNSAKGHNYGGLHIHISNKYITTLQLTIMATILYNYINSPEYNAILQITQRTEKNIEDWASLDIDNYLISGEDRQAFFEKVYNRGFISTDKYTGINTNHNPTIEFRIFNSNLRIERLQKNFEFIRALINFSKYIARQANYNYSLVNIDNCTIWNLIEYCKKNNKHNKYTTFLNFLLEKGIKEPETIQTIENIA